jgi:hypothetical protein
MKERTIATVQGEIEVLQKKTEGRNPTAEEAGLLESLKAELQKLTETAAGKGGAAQSSAAKETESFTYPFKGIAAGEYQYNVGDAKKTLAASVETGPSGFVVRFLKEKHVIPLSEVPKYGVFQRKS